MSMIKKALKEWADLLIFAPLSLGMLIVAYFGIHLVDQTAAILDIGVLQILFLNLLVYLLVNGLAYFSYKLNFTDYFKAGWGKDLTPAHKLAANVALWLAQLGIAAFILTRNL